MRNVTSSGHVEKIPKTILVPKDNNFEDQAFWGLEATLVSEDSSSEDQLVDINDEREVNSGTSLVKIPENRQEAHVTPSSLSLIVVPAININNHVIVPICSSMSGLLLGITKDSSFLKDIF
ncbi:hypothetical protein Adt_41876 [Abeliophyllum distichum]|uniref:Uncharacterized protein n=1 Tax=Abeliophyllum distichum TaxID=126358 RepID=A0ABD1PQ35_9LAMI